MSVTSETQSARLSLTSFFSADSCPEASKPLVRSLEEGSPLPVPTGRWTLSLTTPLAPTTLTFTLVAFGRGAFLGRDHVPLSQCIDGSESFPGTGS